MHSNLRNIIWLTCLAAAAAGTWYLARDGDPDAYTPSTSGQAALGYYLKGATILGTDQQGDLIYRVIAVRVEQDPSTERLELSGVEVEYRDEEDVPWTISADRASGVRDAEALDLSGNVRIERSLADVSPRLLITAPALQLKPREHFVSTDGPVTFLVGDTWIDAVGLKAHLKDEKIDLESNVHAQVHQ